MRGIAGQNKVDLHLLDYNQGLKSVSI